MQVSVRGQDIVYKDVIEPLESVSVSITKTDKEVISDFGTPAEVRASCCQRHARHALPLRAPSPCSWTTGMPATLAHAAQWLGMCWKQVALTLAEKVLTPPKQDVKVLDVAQVCHCSGAAHSMPDCARSCSSPPCALACEAC